MRSEGRYDSASFRTPYTPVAAAPYTVSSDVETEEQVVTAADRKNNTAIAVLVDNDEEDEEHHHETHVERQLTVS